MIPAPEFWGVSNQFYDYSGLQTASPFGRGLTRTAAALSYLPRATAITGVRRLAAARVRLSQSGHRID
ncbi:MAG: hypothetical protein ACKVIB_06360 [Pseudomonadales bacterium]